MDIEQTKFHQIAYEYSYITVGDDVDYCVTIDDKKQEVVLAFQSSKDPKWNNFWDWFHNISILPVPVKLAGKWAWTTRGYAGAYRSAKDVPFDAFLVACIEHPGYKRCIRGWSIGSAMAKIAARHYNNFFRIKNSASPEALDELTTFGDVKCWLNPFYSIRDMAKRVRVYTNSNDIVTYMVPFYHRDRGTKCSVGDGFSFKKILHSIEYHCSYDKYDYSKYLE